LFPTEVTIPNYLRIVRHLPLLQMILDGSMLAVESTSSATIKDLSAVDAPAMCELATLTEPGPFGSKTQELGTYLGIYEGGQLAAMAGERMRLKGMQEISAVCTHPDHRRKGYAQLLMREIIRRCREKDPLIVFFLHVKADNIAAIKTYERLGFRVRASLQYYLIRPR